MSHSGDDTAGTHIVMRNALLSYQHALDTRVKDEQAAHDARDEVLKQLAHEVSEENARWTTERLKERLKAEAQAEFDLDAVAALVRTAAALPHRAPVSTGSTEPGHPERGSDYHAVDAFVNAVRAYGDIHAALLRLAEAHVDQRDSKEAHRLLAVLTERGRDLTREGNRYENKMLAPGSVGKTYRDKTSEPDYLDQVISWVAEQVPLMARALLVRTHRDEAAALIARGDIYAAREQIKKALELEPNDAASVSIQRMVYLASAQGLLRGHRAEEAVALLREWLATHQADPEISALLSDAQRRSGRRTWWRWWRW